MRTNDKISRGSLKRRFFCTMIALVMFAGLAAVASANIEKPPCLAHAEHDDTCGYVEAQPASEGMEAVEAQSCTHACALCDPVEELKDIKVEYDKYADSTEHKEIKVSYQKNHDVLQEVQTYVYNEAGARMQDEKGEFVKVTLTKDVDYAVSPVEKTEGMEEVTFKNSYLDSLYLLPYTYILRFESGQDQEIEVTITETTSQKEETPKAVTHTSVGAYSVTLNASSIAEDEPDYPYSKEKRNGTLQINANLSTSGETHRYLLIQVPDYGVCLADTLPGIAGGITAVKKMDERTLRLDIADSVDETLNLAIVYEPTSYTFDNIMKEWRKGNVPAATGFKVSIHGKVSGTEQEFTSKSYGNWKLNPSGTKPAMSIGLAPADVFDRSGLSGFMKYLNPGTVSNFSDWKNAHEKNSNGRILNAISFSRGESPFGGYGSRGTQGGYLKSVKLYADPVLLQNVLWIEPYNLPSDDQSTFISQGYKFIESIQSDETGTYLEVKCDSSTKVYDNTAWEAATRMLYVWAIKDVKLQNLSENTEYPVRVVSTIGNYTTEGIEEVEQILEFAYKTSQFVEGDCFKKPIFSQYMNKDRAQEDNYRLKGGADMSSVYTGFVNEAVSAEFGQSKVTIPEDIYEGLVEVFEFPYEIQPWRISRKLSDRDFVEHGIVERMVYTFSDGTVHSVSGAELGFGDGWDPTYNPKQSMFEKNFSTSYRQRVTKVEIKWKKYYQSRKNVDSESWGRGFRFDFRVPETKENGELFDRDYRVRVKSTVKKGDGTILGVSTADELNYYFKENIAACPVVVADNNVSWRSHPEILSEEGKETSFLWGNSNGIKYNTKISPKFAYGDFVQREKVKSPILSVRWSNKAFGNSTNKVYNVTDAELVGYTFTGKMTVYPRLAGWKVTYCTRNNGMQSFTLPEVIEASGYIMSLPVAGGDRIVGFNNINENYSVVEFSKDGEDVEFPFPIYYGMDVRFVSGIVYCYPRKTDEGLELDNGLSNTLLYTKGITYLSLTNDDCTCVYEGRTGIHMNSSGKDELEGRPALVNTFFNSHMRQKKGKAANNSSTTGYQDENIKIKFSTSGRSLDVDNDKSDSPRYTDYTSLVGGRTDSFRMDWKPIVYIKLLHPDITYLGGDVTLNDKQTNTSLIEANDGSTWLRIEVREALPKAFWRKTDYSNGYTNNQGAFSVSRNVNGVIPLYIFPGAKLGANQAVLGDVYIEDNYQQWQDSYHGNEEDYYTTYSAEGLVPDTLNLRQTGDTVTPNLQHYPNRSAANILQKVFVGIRVVPGAGSSYRIDTRKQELYPSDRRRVQALASVSTDNDNVVNHTSVYELPRAGKTITGNLFSDIGGVEKELSSEFNLWLRGPVTVASNTTGKTAAYSYRINGTWYTEAEAVTNGGWSQVDAVKIVMAEIPKNSSINFRFPLEAEEKTDETELAAYLGGTYSYETNGVGSSSGRLVLAEYVYHPYKIQGHIFKDYFEDGNQDDESDTNIKGITVNLRKRNTDDIVATAVTDNDGKYSMSTMEQRNLYVEVEVPEGQKLTTQYAGHWGTSDKDSDFNRETNRYELDSPLDSGAYSLSAGIVTLPVLTAPDVTVRLEEPVNTKVRAVWAAIEPQLKHEQTANTKIAVIDSVVESNTGRITPVSVGTTTATVWMENRLGDRIEKTFNIEVTPRIVNINLVKQLTEVADADYTFVFKINKLGEEDSIEQTFYQTINIPQGNSSASITLKQLIVGKYQITEVESNWRYEVQGMTSQTVEATNPDAPSTVTFTNSRTNNKWSSGSSSVTNIMESVSP